MPLFIALSFLSGCGFKIIHTTDLDESWYACQSAGFAQCRAKKDKLVPNPLTPEEAKEILYLLKEKPVVGTSPYEKLPINIQGYRRLQ